MVEEKLRWGHLDTISSKSIIIKYDPELRKEYEIEDRKPIVFSSASVYIGGWSVIDMEGFGTYILPHGVLYEGHLKDGRFHGKGILIYPAGNVIMGEWHKGELISWRFEFKNLKLPSLETYCKLPDRRFLTTMNSELPAAGRENLTNELPTRGIPEGCYDVVDGFFNPKTLWVHSAEDFNKFLYMPASRDYPGEIDVFKDQGYELAKKVPFVPVYRTSKWIIENCRKAWDESTGYKPQLYEYWFTGRKADRDYLKMRLEKDGGKFVWNESISDRLSRNFREAAALLKEFKYDVGAVKDLRTLTAENQEQSNKDINDWQGIHIDSIENCGNIEHDEIPNVVERQGLQIEALS